MAFDDSSKVSSLFWGDSAPCGGYLTEALGFLLSFLFSKLYDTKASDIQHVIGVKP